MMSTLNATVPLLVLSIFRQTVLSALESGLAFLPFAITAGTVVARHLLGHASPRAIAAVGMLLAAAGDLLPVEEPPMTPIRLSQRFASPVPQGIPLRRSARSRDAPVPLADKRPQPVP